MGLSLAEAVETAIALVYEQAPDDAETQYVRNPVRLQEAEEVELVAAAFARAEIEARDKGLGNYGFNMIPSLGQQLRRKLARAGEDEREGVADAIKKAMGMGYVGFMSLEPGAEIGIKTDTDLKRVWDLTVRNFRAGGLRQLGLANDFCKTIEGFGESAMVGDLRRAGLLGWRTGRVGLVGRYYGNAGGWMRAAQTDVELPPEVAAVTTARPDLWPFEQYVRS